MPNLGEAGCGPTSRTHRSRPIRRTARSSASASGSPPGDPRRVRLDHPADRPGRPPASDASHERSLSRLLLRRAHSASCCGPPGLRQHRPPGPVMSFGDAVRGPPLEQVAVADRRRRASGADGGGGPGPRVDGPVLVIEREPRDGGIPRHSDHLAMACATCTVSSPARRTPAGSPHRPDAGAVARDPGDGDRLGGRARAGGHGADRAASRPRRRCGVGDRSAGAAAAGSADPWRPPGRCLHDRSAAGPCPPAPRGGRVTRRRHRRRLVSWSAVLTLREADCATVAMTTNSDAVGGLCGVPACRSSTPARAVADARQSRRHRGQGPSHCSGRGAPRLRAAAPGRLRHRHHHGRLDPRPRARAPGPHRSRPRHPRSACRRRPTHQPGGCVRRWQPAAPRGHSGWRRLGREACRRHGCRLAAGSDTGGPWCPDPRPLTVALGCAAGRRPWADSCPEPPAALGRPLSPLPTADSDAGWQGAGGATTALAGRAGRSSGRRTPWWLMPTQIGEPSPWI